MTDEIKPALTPEQWAGVPRVYFRPQRGRDAGYGVEINMVNGGRGESASLWVWDDSWALTVNAENRHALAALALYQQPFGFTHEDVTELLEAARDCHADNADRRESIAARIAALLPPLMDGKA